ncbi:hypothetical protein HK101_003959 [Irineochytrium annulatum]|nr:hypothetical protein HK101_003959 [Irineochytrium annulatum]
MAQAPAPSATPAATPTATPGAPAPSVAPGTNPNVPAVPIPGVVGAPNAPGIAPGTTVVITVSGTTTLSVVPATTTFSNTAGAPASVALPNPNAGGANGATPSPFVVTQTVIGAVAAGPTPSSDLGGSTGSSTALPVAVIAGIVIGVCALLIVIIVAVCILMARSRRAAALRKDPRLMGVVVSHGDVAPPSYAPPVVVRAAATPEVVLPPSFKPNPNTRDVKDAAAASMGKGGSSQASNGGHGGSRVAAAGVIAGLAGAVGSAPRKTPSPTPSPSVTGGIDVFPGDKEKDSAVYASGAGSHASAVSSEGNSHASHPKIAAEEQRLGNAAFEQSTPPRGVAAGGAWNAVGGRVITIMGEGLPAYDDNMAMDRRVETAEARVERAEALVQRLAREREEDQRRLRDLEIRMKGDN